MANTEIRFFIFFAAEDGEALFSQQKQDQELTVAQFMNSLLPKTDWNWRKWRKPYRPFRYDLNQIPYDYTGEVRNRFKGLDLTDRVPDELCNEVHDIVQEAVIKTIPHFSSVQLLSRVWLFETPWIEVRQASLSITNCWSSLRLTSIESLDRKSVV